MLLVDGARAGGRQNSIVDKRFHNLNEKHQTLCKERR